MNLDVISWLGVWYVKSDLYEQSIQFFDRACQIQPTEVKWRLMLTACYRRMGSYQKALQMYIKMHHEFPENVECLRYVIAICSELSLPSDEYQKKKTKMERIQAVRNTGAISRMGENNHPETKQSPNSNSNSEQNFSNSHDFKEHPKETSFTPPSQNIHSNSKPERKSGKNKQHENLEASDEWGDADVGDLLAD